MGGAKNFAKMSWAGLMSFAKMSFRGDVWLPYQTARDATRKDCHFLQVAAILGSLSPVRGSSFCAGISELPFRKDVFIVVFFIR